MDKLCTADDSKSKLAFLEKHIKRHLQIQITKYTKQIGRDMLPSSLPKTGFHSFHNNFSAVHSLPALHSVHSTQLHGFKLAKQNEGALALLTNVGLFGTLILFGDSLSFQKRTLDGAARTHFQNTLLRVSDIQDTF